MDISYICIVKWKKSRSNQDYKTLDNKISRIGLILRADISENEDKKFTTFLQVWDSEDIIR